MHIPTFFDEKLRLSSFLSFPMFVIFLQHCVPFCSKLCHGWQIFNPIFYIKFILEIHKFRHKFFVIFPALHCRLLSSVFTFYFLTGFFILAAGRPAAVSAELLWLKSQSGALQPGDSIK